MVRPLFRFTRSDFERPDRQPRRRRDCTAGYPPSRSARASRCAARGVLEPHLPPPPSCARTKRQLSCVAPHNSKPAGSRADDAQAAVEIPSVTTTSRTLTSRRLRLRTRRRNLLAIHHVSRGARESPADILFVGGMDVVAIADVDGDRKSRVAIGRDRAALRIAQPRPATIDRRCRQRSVVRELHDEERQRRVELPAPVRHTAPRAALRNGAHPSSRALDSPWYQATPRRPYLPSGAIMRVVEHGDAGESAPTARAAATGPRGATWYSQAVERHVRAVGESQHAFVRGPVQAAVALDVEHVDDDEVVAGLEQLRPAARSARSSPKPLPIARPLTKVRSTSSIGAERQRRGLFAPAPRRA